MDSESLYESLYESLRHWLQGVPFPPETMRRACLLADVMRWFARLRGHESEAAYWAAAGLLHRAGEAAPLPDAKALRSMGADDRFLAAVTARDIPEKAGELPALLVTLGHLTALIDAIAATRPRRSVKGLKVAAVQKKFRDLRFAPQSARPLIRQGARHLKWEIGDLTSKTIKAMEAAEEERRSAAIA